MIAVRGGAAVARNEKDEKGFPCFLDIPVLYMTAVIARVRLSDTRNNSSL